MLPPEKSDLWLNKRDCGKIIVTSDDCCYNRPCIQQKHMNYFEIPLLKAMKLGGEDSIIFFVRG